MDLTEKNIYLKISENSDTFPLTLVLWNYPESVLNLLSN